MHYYEEVDPLFIEKLSAFWNILQKYSSEKYRSSDKSAGISHTLFDAIIKRFINHIKQLENENIIVEKGLLIQLSILIEKSEMSQDEKEIVEFIKKELEIGSPSLILLIDNEEIAEEISRAEAIQAIMDRYLVYYPPPKEEFQDAFDKNSWGAETTAEDSKESKKKDGLSKRR